MFDPKDAGSAICRISGYVNSTTLRHIPEDLNLRKNAPSVLDALIVSLRTGVLELGGGIAVATSVTDTSQFVNIEMSVCKTWVCHMNCGSGFTGCIIAPSLCKTVK